MNNNLNNSIISLTTNIENGDIIIGRIKFNLKTYSHITNTLRPITTNDK